MLRRKKVIAIMALLVLGTLFLAKDNIKDQFFKPTSSTIKQGTSPQDLATEPEIVAQDLTVPWGIAFLPGGEVLVTERSGNLLRIGDNKQTFPVEGVAHIGEGGLLGIALHPRFEQNRQLYLYLTTKSGNSLTNRIDRYRYENNQLSSRTVILENIPGASNHDGGRIAFGPDGLLYATTGDAGIETLAQDKNSLAGKILRMTDEGKIPNDNPFGNLIYSYGHRNPQGLAWDSKGQLWSTEHGRSGLSSGFDELNLIKKGANYGWPEFEGDETASGIEIPILHSGANETWAPASLAYINNSLFFGGLRGQTLYQAKISDNNKLSLVAHLRESYGRIRTVTKSPDNFLYLTTSNTDGRGDQKSNDDKVIKIDPRIFNN
jgi:glucose/arabinose dehydrogenase